MTDKSTGAFHRIAGILDAWLVILGVSMLCVAFLDWVAYEHFMLAFSLR